MQRPSLPLDESTRLATLRELNILDTPAEERFDRVTRLVQRIFAAPVITIGLVDATREWFKSSIGLTYPQIARDISFAAHAIHGSDTFFVDDARKDARFFDNPLVTSEPYISFYAAQPLTASDGSVVGVLEMFDQRARAAMEDFSLFRDLARIAETELRTATLSRGQEELLREHDPSGTLARIDPLTRLWSRAATIDVLQRELSHARREGSHVGVLLIDIDHLRDLNTSRGHDEGDAALREIARRVRTYLRPYDSVGRFGGEEFLVVLPGTDLDGAVLAAERVRLAVTREPVVPQAALTISIGASASEASRNDTASLMRDAELALVRSKSLGGNRVSG